MPTTSTALAIAPQPTLPHELLPRPSEHTGYERRLRVDAERTWPMFEHALRQAGGVRLLSAVASALFEVASVLRTTTDRARHAEGRRSIVEQQLAPLLADKGLTLKLACASVGVPLERVQSWVRLDPQFAQRIEGYRRRGLAKLHGKMVEKGVGGSETAIKFLLETSGEDEYVQRLRVGDLDESDVVRSRAWGKLMQRLVGALGPGHTCAACGGCSCRQAVGEELGRG
jgi:hypothetical protein